MPPQAVAELYYVIEGERRSSWTAWSSPCARALPGVVHGAKGRMKVLVVGLPDISDEDRFFPV